MLCTDGENGHKCRGTTIRNQVFLNPCYFHCQLSFAYPTYQFITHSYPSADVNIRNCHRLSSKAPTGGRPNNCAARPPRRRRALPSEHLLRRTPHPTRWLSAPREEPPKFENKASLWKSKFGGKTETRGASLREGWGEGTIADLDGDAGVGTRHCRRRRGAPRTAADPVGAPRRL